MRFLADMGISPHRVAFLNDLGHETIHLHEQGPDRMQDAAIIEKAREEGRVILTHDLDFGELIAASGAMLPSIIVFRLRNMHPERVNRYMERIITEYLEPLQRGAVLSVTEVQARVRFLPIENSP